MTRPASHYENLPARRCGSCRHSAYVEFKRDTLCFFGDNVRIGKGCDYPTPADSVELDGRDVGSMDGEEYSEVWAGRIVHPNLGTCDEWSLRSEAEEHG